MLTLQKSRRGSGLIAKSSDSAGGLLPAPCICRGASALSAPLLAAWRLGPTSVSRSGTAKTSAMRQRPPCLLCPHHGVRWGCFPAPTPVPTWGPLCLSLRCFLFLKGRFLHQPPHTSIRVYVAPWHPGPLNTSRLGTCSTGQLLGKHSDAHLAPAWPEAQTTGLRPRVQA